MPTARLRTDAPTLTCPPDKAQVYYTDSETPRLRLRVARSGRHVWDWRSVAGTDVLGVYEPAGVAGLSYAEAKRLADHRNALLNRGASVETAVVLPVPVRTVEDMLRYHIKEKLTEETWERREKETRRGAESAIRPLVARYGHLPVEEFTSHHLLHAVRAAGLANRTAGQKLVKTVRAAWNFCHGRRVLPPFDRSGAPLVNPASNLIKNERDLKIPQRKSYKRALGDDQIVALLHGIERGKAAWRDGRRASVGETPMRWPMGFVALEFLLYTGCRKMEAQILHVTDILSEVIRLPRHKTQDSDGDRIIHLTPLAKRVLADAARLRAEMGYNGPLVFPGANGGEISAIDDYLTTACELAGIPRLVPHSLRSVYINLCVRQGTPIEIASKNVGQDRSMSRGSTTKCENWRSAGGMPRRRRGTSSG